MDKIKTIISKEWAEVFKNRLVLFTVLFLPLIFIALPLVTVGAIGSTAGEVSEAMEEEAPDEFMAAVCGDELGGLECVQVYMINIYTLLFMILPISIPVTIAAYSIVGEKTTRSLEPLLATPITTGELIAGKALAAIIPAVAATWFGYIIYAIAMRFLVTNAVFAHVLDTSWLLAIFVVGPLLTMLSVSVSIMVSSRVSDPRVAEQLSTVVILPLILAVVGQSIGLFILNRQIVLIAAVVIGLLDALLLYLVVKVFQRENILTRWK
jgi:ABC-2 type transport system permease protein